MENSIKVTVRWLRRNQTNAERIFWKAIRNRQFAGYKFRRQYPIAFKYDGKKRCFVADFYCPVCRTVVEIDGGIHMQRQDYDKLRTHIINVLGYRVIRYTNEEVENNITGVLKSLSENSAIFSPSPFVKMERGTKGVR